jgi:hypothetical protein
LAWVTSKVFFAYFSVADVIDPLPVIEGNPEELVKEIKNKPVKTQASLHPTVSDQVVAL